jgi:hypothetical protein
MPSRFDAPAFEEIDLTKPYDIYISEAPHGMVVYRGAFFGDAKWLARTARYDSAADFIEIKQSNGHSVFVRRHAIVKFCEPGVKLISEKIDPTRG